ncbi:hypothetical protein [Nonlabens ponticola]|uniref:Uncharacterized protein n=1 Tax=Nonlabens ponticola TaxID=2496866 RepID=A0A3S9MV27_9FLAO|nr:hypothetical protein [Nonlabens ponticola]AZQ43027.1 hypothetical protein EJ995_01815 [Nonlabens ponticola]
MKKLLLLLSLIAVISCKNEEPAVDDSYNAVMLAQKIASGTSWEQEFTEDEILTETRFVREYNGTRMIKTIYPDTSNELFVVYLDSIPQELYWHQTGEWTTPYGTVGQPIAALEQANGASIEFYGLGYDVPGKVEINKGKLANLDIKFQVRPTSDTIPSEFYSYNKFDSTVPEADALDLYLSRITIPVSKDATLTVSEE